MILNLAQLNSNLVIVLTTGGGVETESWVHKVPALIHSFFLGEISGKVIGRILSGKSNPGGKLPFTMARNWEDFESAKYYVSRPEKTSFRQVAIGQGNPKLRKVWPMVYEEGLRIGYRHFDDAGIEPQFAFGHGLSYTSFKLSNIKITKKEKNVEVSVMVTNIGKLAGSEVVQCYVHDVEASVFRPEQELKAFAKVFLHAGESKRFMLSLPYQAFSFFDVKNRQWLLEPGVFELRIGTSSRKINHIGRIAL